MFFFFLNTFLILRYSLFSFLNVTSVEGLTYALLQAKCLFQTNYCDRPPHSMEVQRPSDPEWLEYWRQHSNAILTDCLIMNDSSEYCALFCILYCIFGTSNNFENIRILQWSLATLPQKSTNIFFAKHCLNRSA